jgi:thiamine-phosphate pyrophosphorylase
VKLQETFCFYFLLLAYFLQKCINSPLRRRYWAEHPNNDTKGGGRVRPLEGFKIGIAGIENAVELVLLIIKCGVVPEEARLFFLCAIFNCYRKKSATNYLSQSSRSNFHYSISIRWRIIRAVMERAVYRIIDANFNRAREAIRVIEDFCRFALNSGPLTNRVKQLRHELSAAIDKFDASRLISSRDTLGDVGVGQTVDKQLQRTDLYECFTAGCKRLTEALRTLAETTQTLNPAVASTIEKLRYTVYTLEKDIVVFSEPAEKFKRVEVYVIISNSLPADVLSLTHRCAAGGADCIQLRAKDADDDKLFAMAAEFVQICKAADVLSIINDRVDIAVAAGAEGVHFGQNDLPIEQARKLQSAPLIIGKSTHSLEQLRAGCKERPTYVSLGPVFATKTKPTAEAVGLDYVRQGTEELADTGIGHVAIGGITLDNVEEVLSSGARTIAVCAAVTEAADPTAACRALKQKVTAFNKD